LISSDIRRNQEIPGDTARRREARCGQGPQEGLRRVAELAERLTTYSRDAALPGAELYLILENHAVQCSLPVMDKVLHYIAEKLGYPKGSGSARLAIGAPRYRCRPRSPGPFP